MSEQEVVRSQESVRHEYSEVVQNIRHYSNLRFAILTIFFAVMGGVGFVAFGKGQFDAHAAKIARVAGFFVTAVFWLWLERVAQHFTHYVKVAAGLERHLGYTQFSTRPPAQHFYLEGNTGIQRMIFVPLALLWVYAAFTVPLAS